MSRSTRVFSLVHAFEAHPGLQEVAARVRQSQAMLGVVQALLPAGLRPQLQAGPLDEDSWCVLVANPAVASKMRHLAPTLLAGLHQAGYTVARLRVKVQAPT